MKYRDFFLRLSLIWALTSCTAVHNSGQSLASSAPRNVKDGLLAAAVKAKLFAIDIDSAQVIRVSVSDGRVTLAGQARSEKQRGAYEDAARSVSGVAGVIDRVSINPRMPSTRETARDAALSARVATALAAQTGVNIFSVRTASRNGIVTLSGTVHSQALKTAMLETAHKVNDVRTVVDRLTVAP
ncbi:MAG: BON domain-containing protein [Candidatus Eremiobacteraeota bacterium]|nr:BON domain-containing protein [Candidatus Eremiobacteraeota bacterium]